MRSAETSLESLQAAQPEGRLRGICGARPSVEGRQVLADGVLGDAELERRRLDRARGDVGAQDLELAACRSLRSLDAVQAVAAQVRDCRTEGVRFTSVNGGLEGT